MKCYDFFKDFQPIIASIIAIIGVIGTLYWNGRLARISEDRKQQQQRKIITTFLISDLTINHEILTSGAKLLDEADTDDVNIPANISTIDPNILADKIGILKYQEAHSTLKTYRFYAELPIRLKLISTHSSSDYITIPNNRRKIVAQLFRNCASEIENTLGMLKKSLD